MEMMNRSIFLLSVVLILCFGNTRGIPQRDKQPIKDSLLKLFGVQNMPNPEVISHINKNATSAKTYMLDLYEFSERHHEQWGQFTNKSVDLVNRADTVVSFVNNGKHVELNPRHVMAKPQFLGKQTFLPRPNTSDVSGEMYFDIKSNFLIEKTLTSELRIYLDVTKKIVSDTRLEISVYQTLVPRKKFKLLLGTEIDASTSRWHEFDLLEAAQTWRENDTYNHGVVLTCRTLNKTEVSIDTCGFINFNGSEEHKPFMVSFYQSGDEEEIFAEQLPGPALREVQQALHERLRRSLEHQRLPGDVSQLRDGLTRSNHTKEQESNSCDLQDLYIGFRDLGWSEWILAPNGYSAKYCVGKCSFPLDKSDATTHAILQALVSITEENIPRPCCAPRKLRSLRVLFVDEGDNIVMKQYENMIVERCICQ